jgi:hypothetical protein
LIRQAKDDVKNDAKAFQQQHRFPAAADPSAVQQFSSNDNDEYAREDGRSSYKFGTNIKKWTDLTGTYHYDELIIMDDDRNGQRQQHRVDANISLNESNGIGDGDGFNNFNVKTRTIDFLFSELTPSSFSYRTNALLFFGITKKLY